VLGCSLRELGQRVDSREFAIWKAFDRLCPLDAIKRLELAIGRLCAVQVPGTSTNDFVTDWGRRFTQVADLERHLDSSGEIIGVDPDKLDAVFNKLAGN
jgi:hypothetical protein